MQKPVKNMPSTGKITVVSYQVSNLISSCCLLLLKEKIETEGISVKDIRPGRLVVAWNQQQLSEKKLKELLAVYGIEILETREQKLVEQIKQAVIELVHQMNNVDSIVRKSEYLVEKLGMSYQQLSRVFNAQEPITLEKYIILNKIERTKELIDSNEYTLSEIAYMMDYSSVQYLSNQFRQITGISVSEYKLSDQKVKSLIDKLDKA
ncbi:MAG TPA: AraC family transcriptional regulator [Bacteroidales bacterium]|nr:AraC family transcriptional regulator [Bacteroidales bacterium]